MSIQTIMFNGLLNAIASFNPKLGDAIRTVQKFASSDTGAKIGDVLKAGIKEGPHALDVIKREAPELAHAIGALVSSSETGGSRRDALHAENAARQIFGYPHMSPEEENRWMDRATPGNDPSQENSRSGSG